MEHLVSQELFESFLGNNPTDAPIPGFIVVWFSAKWCGPCRRINENMLLEMNTQPKWYKCDIDENSYTAGYCNIRSIPTFLAIINKKVVGTYQSSDTFAITKWVQDLANTVTK